MSRAWCSEANFASIKVAQRYTAQECDSPTSWGHSATMAPRRNVADTKIKSLALF